MGNKEELLRIHENFLEFGNANKEVQEEVLSEMKNVAFVYKKDKEFKLVRYAENFIKRCDELENKGFIHFSTINAFIFLEWLLNEKSDELKIKAINEIGEI